MSDAVGPQCIECGTRLEKLYHCARCGFPYCAQDWDKPAVHRNDPAGVHVKSDPLLFQRYKDIFESLPRQEQEELHRKDVTSKWFGTTRQPNGTMMLVDYIRYTTLMSASVNDHPVSNPRLV